MLWSQASLRAAKCDLLFILPAAIVTLHVIIENSSELLKLTFLDVLVDLLVKSLLGGLRLLLKVLSDLIEDRFGVH